MDASADQREIRCKLNNKSAKSAISSRWKYGCLSMALFAPLLSGCSSDDMMSLFTDNNSPEQITISDNSGELATAATTLSGIDSAACGLFFGAPAPGAAPVRSLAVDNAEEPVSLRGDPASDLRHALALDLSLEHAKARRLYLWLTAADPNASTTINCGNGIMLTGSITSLAQKRLEALDTDNPDLARSREIDAVVASAIVAPGPELPDPPSVQRNRDFYKNTIPVNAPPEDSTGPRPVMEMDVSSNTARLTSVDRPARQIASPASKTVPMAVANEPAAPRTIKGDAMKPSASNNALLSTTHPVESGTLELADETPATSSTLIEVPMVDRAEVQPEPLRVTNVPETAPDPAPRSASVSRQPQTATILPAYYTVQLAAYRSREMAESRWPRFQEMGDGILSGADHEVQSIAIEGKGLFFRLMTGQYASQSEAQSACNGLKRAGIDCLIRQISP